MRRVPIRQPSWVRELQNGGHRFNLVFLLSSRGFFVLPRNDSVIISGTTTIHVSTFSFHNSSIVRRLTPISIKKQHIALAFICQYTNSCHFALSYLSYVIIYHGSSWMPKRGQIRQVWQPSLESKIAVMTMEALLLCPFCVYRFFLMIKHGACASSITLRGFIRNCITKKFQYLIFVKTVQFQLEISLAVEPPTKLT